MRDSGLCGRIQQEATEGFRQSEAIITCVFWDKDSGLSEEKGKQGPQKGSEDNMAGSVAGPYWQWGWGEVDRFQRHLGGLQAAR